MSLMHDVRLFARGDVGAQTRLLLQVDAESAWPLLLSALGDDIAPNESLVVFSLFTHKVRGYRSDETLTQ